MTRRRRRRAARGLAVGDRVLVVDDDPPLRRMLARTLSAEGFEVTVAADGGRGAGGRRALGARRDRARRGDAGHRRALGLPPAAQQGPADADPDADRARRRRRSRGRAGGGRRRLPGQAVRDRGADRAAARADPPRQGSRTRCSPTPTSSLDTSTRVATPRRAGPIELTGREAALLELLLRDPGHTVTRERAIDEIWDGAAEANVVDRYVTRLRRKLGDPPLIRTLRGAGFVLRA